MSANLPPTGIDAARWQRESKPHRRRPRVLVAGVGSYHGDDQVGWLASQALADCIDSDAASIRTASSPLELADWLAEEFDRLIVIDACRGLGAPGKLRRIAWPSDALLQTHWLGSHDLPLPAVLELSAVLNRLPPDVVIWAVEAARKQPCEGLSPEVSASLPLLIQQVAADVLSGWSHDPATTSQPPG